MIHWQTGLLFALVFVIVADAYREKEQVCARHFTINGTQLMSNNRQQILVMGISHLGCQACRNQAVR
jgi:hypothetical protein